MSSAIAVRFVAPKLAVGVAGGLLSVIAAAAVLAAGSYLKKTCLRSPPAGDPFGASTAPESQEARDLARRPTRSFGGQLAWLGCIMSAYALRPLPSHTRAIGQAVLSLRSTPAFSWLPVAEVARPLRNVAAAYLLAQIARWAVPKALRKFESPIGARFTTWFISRRLRASPLSSSQQRQVFVELPPVSTKAQTNHTHGVAARDRNTASATAGLAARTLGLEPYYVQQSLADVRKARAGDRSYHWAKDLAIPPTPFHLDPERHAAVLVDVDHYVDMPRLLATKPGTYFVCAFQPTAVAQSEGEFSFRFLEDGKVLYRVSGGAEYRHEVWDYAGDTVLVEDSGFLQKQVVAYHIDRKRVAEHHVIVLLSLIGRFTIPIFFPTRWFIEGKRLGRLQPVIGKHAVLDVVRPDGLYRSVAILGDYNAVTLPRAQFDAVHAVACTSRVPINAAMVSSNVAPSSAVGLPAERMPPGHAAILADYTRAGVPEFAPVVYPPSESMLAMSFGKHDYTAPVPLAGFGSPLIRPSYGFVGSISSDDRCIAGRVEQFQQKPEPVLSPTLAGYMEEFSQFLIPDAYVHKGHPVDDDEVYERQPRPTQRALLAEAGATGAQYKDVIRSFVKKETYPKPTDPRCISTVAPAPKLKYSKFIYAFSDEIMANQPWYAFALTPVGVATRVVEVLKYAPFSVVADGSRFDGHVRRSTRVLERLIMLRFFAPEHHSALNEVMDKHINQPGVTEHGRRYLTGFSRLSGGTDTSTFNSIVTAFIGYCAQRETTIGGVRRTPEEAWEALGIYGGDDSLEGFVDPAALKRSAANLGQDYEIKVVRRGELGVEFLNRQFGPAVFDGDMNSMANPSRLLAKLFVGPTRLEDPLTRLAERLSGYYRMDRNSPVIGSIVTAAHQLMGEHHSGVLMPWDGRTPAISNWPNEYGEWMEEVFYASIPDFDYPRFSHWIQTIYRTRDKSLFLRAPLCTAPDVDVVVKHPMIIADDIYFPKPSAPPAPEPVATAVAAPAPEPERLPQHQPAEPSAPPPPEQPAQVPASRVYQDWTYVSDEEDDGAGIGGPGFDDPHQDTNSNGGLQDQSRPFESPVDEADSLVIRSRVRSEQRELAAAQAAAAAEAKAAASKAAQGKSAAAQSKPKDPRDWKKPAIRRGESDQAFAGRLQEWELKRATVAKRAGVALTPGAQGGGSAKL